MNAITIEQLSKVYRLETNSKRRQARGAQDRPARRWWPIELRRPIKEVWALKDVSLEVPRGTILGVIGNNGAGKTTLLRILSRVTLPTAGRALVRGRVASLLGLGTGFQEDLSARENIYLSAALYGIPQAEVDRRFDDIVDFAGLGEFVDNPVGRFSSGMFLRLAFSVAMNMEPDIILADEVLAVGDIAFQEQCLQRVQQAGNEGAAVVFVSHDMRAIERLCHRVVRLERGFVVDAGEPREVVDRYEAAIHAGELDRGKQISSALVRMLALRLLDIEGREIESPIATEDFQVTAHFQTEVPRLTLRVSLEISCGEVLVLESRAPAAIPLERPDAYSIAVRIPGGLLNHRAYGAKFKMEVWPEDADEPVLQNSRMTFRVYGDTLDGQARLVRRTRLAVIAPRLEWHAAQARAHIEA